MADRQPARRPDQTTLNKSDHAGHGHRRPGPALKTDQQWADHRQPDAIQLPGSHRTGSRASHPSAHHLTPTQVGTMAATQVESLTPPDRCLTSTEVQAFTTTRPPRLLDADPWLDQQAVARSRPPAHRLSQRMPSLTTTQLNAFRGQPNALDLKSSDARSPPHHDRGHQSTTTQVGSCCEAGSPRLSSDEKARGLRPRSRPSPPPGQRAHASQLGACPRRSTVSTTQVGRSDHPGPGLKVDHARHQHDNLTRSGWEADHRPVDGSEHHSIP